MPTITEDKIYVKVSGSWKEADSVLVKHNSSWVNIADVYKKVNESWVKQDDKSGMFDNTKTYIKG